MASPYQQLANDMSAVREDVAAIKAHIEALPDHEIRLRTLERWKYGIPGGAIVALLALFIH
jgi:hypothetical protein